MKTKRFCTCGATATGVKTHNKYVTCVEKIDRITLVGPYSEGITILEQMHADGWRTVRSGPYTDRKIHPKLDVTRFLFVMERSRGVAAKMPGGLG